MVVQRFLVVSSHQLIIMCLRDIMVGAARERAQKSVIHFYGCVSPTHMTPLFYHFLLGRWHFCTRSFHLLRSYPCTSGAPLHRTPFHRVPNDTTCFRSSCVRNCIAKYFGCCERRWCIADLSVHSQRALYSCCPYSRMLGRVCEQRVLLFFHSKHPDRTLRCVPAIFWPHTCRHSTAPIFPRQPLPWPVCQQFIFRFIIVAYLFIYIYTSTVWLLSAFTLRLANEQLTLRPSWRISREVFKTVSRCHSAS